MPGATRIAAPVAVALVVALIAGGCGRTDTLGPQEAIEVMVFDGVDRQQAICMVGQLDGTVSLEKITGLELGLTDDELHLLTATASACAPAFATGGGVLGELVAVDEAAAALQLAGQEELAVYREVEQLVTDGLEPTVGTCLAERLSLLDDAASVMDDVFALSAHIVACREELGLD